MTLAEWQAKGAELFGRDAIKWRFVCPSCGHVQTPEDFRPYPDTNPETALFSCIGRFDGKHGHVTIGTKPGPCNYTSGGLFNLNRVEVEMPDGKKLRVFDFAEAA